MSSKRSPRGSKSAGADLQTHLQTAYGFFNEIGIISQLSSNQMQRAMPHGLTQSQFSVLNWFIRVDDQATQDRVRPQSAGEDQQHHGPEHPAADQRDQHPGPRPRLAHQVAAGPGVDGQVALEQCRPELHQGQGQRGRQRRRDQPAHDEAHRKRPGPHTLGWAQPHQRQHEHELAHRDHRAGRKRPQPVVVVEEHLPRRLDPSPPPLLAPRRHDHEREQHGAERHEQRRVGDEARHPHQHSPSGRHPVDTIRHASRCRPA